MPYCQNCGARISELETNCKACGAIIYPTSATSEPPVKAPAKHGIRIGIAVFVILCVIAGAIFVLMPVQHSDRADSPPPIVLPDTITPAASAAVSEPLRLGSRWHGFLTISNYEGAGESLDGTYEVWGYLGAGAGRVPFFELYDTENVDDDTIILLSMYVDLYADHFVPVIGTEDAWILDIYLNETDVDPLTVYYQNGFLEFEYAYRTNEESCDIEVLVYPE